VAERLSAFKGVPCCVELDNILLHLKGVMGLLGMLLDLICATNWRSLITYSEFG
jgi:hypothetical protein